jgi:hypothetical protein
MGGCASLALPSKARVRRTGASMFLQRTSGSCLVTGEFLFPALTEGDPAAGGDLTALRVG